MSKSVSRALLYLMAFILFLLHNDLWLWHDASLVVGLPVGFVYHILFCFAAAVMLTLLVTYAWPEHLAVDTDNDEDDESP